ncbi:LacI family DNA-binding transcriptional regulator [Mycetocola zhujimingii]|uniref:LacI family DNA-binding transcriptional regulator n=1 Tax=Mycetocola zhujimingii TaxID=2079792 RepID=A0A2U1TFJ7_9MICO|nr:LacI family DNA-binding transcriptional regulator [Mycetocola zhujimingii]AWB85597.1 LacI family transcriptional regulator [Mycetocola zhujimingii]PWC07646.1 LacI family DNA-binding transcriptional regulator [Mycetocola zhujimingii]
MTRRATIHDVAREAGVSVATVSKAVNGRYGIAVDTSRRVMEAVDKLGYASSLVASSMRSRRTGVIGVLVADFEPFSAEILKGVSIALKDSELDLLAYSGSRQRDSAGWERRSLSRLSGTLIDGAIMVTPTVIGASSDIPIVAIDPHAGPADLPTVESDNFGGALLATRHLIQLGHRRVGFVAGRPDLRSSRLREAGYRQGLKEAGIPFRQDLVRVGLYQQDTAKESTASLLGSPDRPTAIFAANDLSAIAVVETAASLGLTVPGDLSVVGFDDIPEAARLSPPLTTIRQSMQQLGEDAVGLLLALMEGQQPADMHIRLPTALVRRATTAAPAA